MLAALGGVAIDRRDRNKAIRTLDRLNNAQGQGPGSDTRRAQGQGLGPDNTPSSSSSSLTTSSSSSSSTPSSAPPPPPQYLPPVDCIAVAPEGTRSLTGQLLPFKKGPFYLWQQLPTYPNLSPGPNPGASPVTDASLGPSPSPDASPSPGVGAYSGRVIVPMVIYGAYDLLPPPSAL